jgi:hypothetical protein
MGLDAPPLPGVSEPALLLLPLLILFETIVFCDIH